MQNNKNIPKKPLVGSDGWGFSQTSRWGDPKPLATIVKAIHADLLKNQEPVSIYVPEKQN